MSTFIGNYTYDSDALVLEVQIGGRMYHYSGVESEVFENFENASSKGHFFNTNIAHEYPYVVKGIAA